MRAVVLTADGGVAVDDVPEPTLRAPGDALVRVRLAAVCGSDLHVKHGTVAGALPGMTMGHEFVGEVVETGDEVTVVAPGDRVVGSFLMPCGTCAACQREAYQVCEDQHIPGYGMFFGDLGGAQAELVVARNADLTLLGVPDGVDDAAALLVGDTLTTAHYANDLAGVGPGTFVAVQGCGPVGLLAVEVARSRGADPVVAVDLAPERLERARELGAATIDVSRSNAGVAIEAHGDGRGAEVVIDTAGGDPALLLQALDLVRPGGRVAVVGVYSHLEVTLPLAELWVGAIDLRFGGVCPVPALWRDVMPLVEQGAVDPTHVVTHRLPLEEAERAYALFEERHALKVLLDVG